MQEYIIIIKLKTIARIADERNDYRIKSRRKFYVLKERAENGPARIRPKDLGKNLAVDKIRRSQTQDLSREPMYIEVEGDYFPDYFEEDGVHFVSMRFWQYLFEELIFDENILYNRIGFITEGRKRIEEYGLIVPEQVDCILSGIARFLRTGIVDYLELDDDKTGELQIFKVKGFPHIVVTAKLNRLDYAGFECTRIENFFDYHGKQRRLYQQRLSGQRMAETLSELENEADQVKDYSFKFNTPGSMDKEKLQREFRQGLQAICDSFHGEEPLAMGELALVFSWEKGTVELPEEHQRDFTVPAFILSSLRPVREYIAEQPQEWQRLGQQLAVETLLHLAAKESRLIDAYEAIHGNNRFRLIIEVDTLKTLNPSLIYDYKNPFQRQVEVAQDLRLFDLNHKDLRGFDFSGKDLTGMRFEGSNLSCAKFHSCILTQAQFLDCNLQGVDFREAQISAARFEGNFLERSDFSGSDLVETVFINSDLRHAKFIKTDLTRACITKGNSLSLVYFYKAKLSEAVITVGEAIFDCSFRLCNLRKVRFSGPEGQQTEDMFGCDFRNADLSDACFGVNRIEQADFTKAKLNGADLSQCNQIRQSKFPWSSCAGLNLAGVQVETSDFSFVNLSLLKVKQDTIFSNCDFTYAKLIGYDFTVAGYPAPNNIVYTDLSECCLEGANLTTGALLFPNLNEVKLKGALIRTSQLKFIILSPKQQQEIRKIIIEDWGD